MAGSARVSAQPIMHRARPKARPPGEAHVSSARMFTDRILGGDQPPAHDRALPRSRPRPPRPHRQDDQVSRRETSGGRSRKAAIPAPWGGQRSVCPSACSRLVRGERRPTSAASPHLTATAARVSPWPHPDVLMPPQTPMLGARPGCFTTNTNGSNL